MTASAPAKTVLIVDDELEIMHAVQAILEDEGFNVLTAADGLEALALLDQQRPDVILMDVMMPRLSGYEVLRLIREQKAAAASAPVILMSCVNPHVKQSDFGWQYFLKKPFAIEDLVAAIRRLAGSADDCQPSHVQDL